MYDEDVCVYDDNGDGSSQVLLLSERKSLLSILEGMQRWSQ